MKFATNSLTLDTLHFSYGLSHSDPFPLQIRILVSGSPSRNSRLRLRTLYLWQLYFGDLVKKILYR